MKNSTIAVRMIPKSVYNDKNTVITHKCKDCNRWISKKVDRCVWCESKKLKRVYGIV